MFTVDVKQQCNNSLRIPAIVCISVSFRVMTFCEDVPDGGILVTAGSTFAWTSWSAMIERLEMSEISDFEDSDNNLFFFNSLRSSGDVSSLFLLVVELTGVDVTLITNSK